MFVEERRDRILQLLDKKNRVSVGELSSLFQIGEATIRRDLSELEIRGLLRRTHGGAIIPDNVSDDIPLKERETRRRDEKERIARFVAQLVRNGETLLIDGGTTTQWVGRMLRTKTKLVIVTNSPPLAQEMVHHNGCQVLLTGGELIEKTNVLVGPITEYTISQFRADRVILGMSALIPEEGFFTPGIKEATVKKIMMKCGKEVIVAMDSSKIGRVSFNFVSDLSAVDKLVTDRDITPEDLAKIERYGVEIITV